MTRFDRLHIILAHNNEPIPTEFENYAKPTQQSELSSRQIQKWKSRRLAHFLLHQCMAQHGLDDALLAKIQETPSGRPYVPHPHVDFNISHSGDWVAVIFRYSQSQNAVGIDIEQPQKTRRYQALLEYYASTQEIAELSDMRYLPQLTTCEQRFYLTWCLREAILKAQGIGIAKLSEVYHNISQQRIESIHCPKGKLFFFYQLPCYLAYFSEQGQMAELTQWKNGQLHMLELEPIIYQVN